MSNKESSDHMASIAGRVMSDAKRGGPVKIRRQEIREVLLAPNTSTDEMLDKIESILKPFVDESESLAACVLGQHEDE